jgi:NADH-quinone oxidoreductase subunit C
MDEQLTPVVSTLVERLEASQLEFQDQVSVMVSPEKIVEACRILRDEFGFDMLLDETAVDYWPKENPRFHLVYFFNSIKNNRIIGLRSPLAGNDPHIQTIEGIFPNANWFEREIWDMFGIHFNGHSDLRRLLMPHDWEGHPLRKDYPLGYEEVQFSFNQAEIISRKPHPKE